MFVTRFRDLGFTVGRLSVGALNAITDVPGVLVGHTTLVRGEGRLVEGQGPVRTGVTAILPHGDNLFRHKVPAAVHTVNGFGKAAGFEQIRERGVIETPILLTNTLNVGRVWDALAAYMLRDNPDIGLTTGTVSAVVGECNDGFLNDLRGRHVGQAEVWAAIEGAWSGAVAEGNVGAGTGTACFGFKGGIGTSSRLVLDGQYTVGVLVQTNYGRRPDMLVLGVPVGQHFLNELLPETPPGSIMMVLATDAPLDSRQLGRLAVRVGFGLARTGAIAEDASGDFVIAFSTANRWLHYPESEVQDARRLTERSSVINEFFAAAIEATEEAIYNALIAAETMTGRDGHTLHAIPHGRLVEILRRYGRG
jgi:D-aminopeptidase